MKRLFTSVTLVALAGVYAYAQTAATPVSEMKQAWNSLKVNLVRLAEKMPEENYSFRPVPEIRSFAEMIAHISDSQVRACSAVRGVPRQGTAASLKSKTDLVAALKASVKECDAAWESVTDANAGEIIKTARGERTRLGAMAVFVLAHSNEAYGYAAVYLRLKGIVPPSSEPRQ